MPEKIFGKEKPLFMAPMAEITHYPFRRMLEKIGGVDVLYTEMLSADLLISRKLSGLPFLIGIESEREKPLVFQLLGNERKKLVRAAKICVSLGADGIDLNLGCSAPFIFKRGMGSGLLMDRDKLMGILKDLRDAVSVPLSVKMRLGMDGDVSKFIEVVKSIEGCGVDFIVIHPRFIKEKFKRRARWEYIGNACKVLNIGVIGNGDIFSYKNGISRIGEFDISGIMVGRGGVYNPWIFKEIKCGREVKKNYLEFFLELIELVVKYFPEKYQLKRIKLFSFFFTRQVFFGHFLWKEINNSDSLSDVEKRVISFFKGGVIA